VLVAENPDSENIDPEVDELEQESHIEPITVPVRLDGPVMVHLLPARHALSRGLSVADTASEVLSGRDLRRASIRIWSALQPIYVGFSKQEVDIGTAAVLPVGLILTMTNIRQIWVRSATPAQVATVSWILESWAD
jgi:hypothetical protein